MLNQETNQMEVAPKLQSGSHNPLNDHDYCSPQKRLQPPAQQDRPQQFNYKSEANSSATGQKVSIKISQSKGSPALESSVASTSSSPDMQKNEKSNDLTQRLPKTFSNDNLSNSPSSSSVSSSCTSNRDLVIAQDSSVNRVKPLASKDTLSTHGPASLRKKLLSKEVVSPDSMSNRVRSKRARQSTSVTDKSEWIMGDDQIDSALSEHLDPDERREKRLKKNKEHDSAFDAYTSSDYTSSDAESDQGSEYNSEDDPDRPWCLCERPFGNKFMICCDICKYWYHGHCVGVTKLMGDRFEKEGKEWLCGECQEKLRAGTPRNAIPEKLIVKEKKKKKPQQSVPGKRGRGRPRKSDAPPKESLTRMSTRNSRKSTSSLDPKRASAKIDARSESFGEFENKERLKELIRERKREFFYKRGLMEQKNAARRNALGLGKQSLAALSDSLDSLATSTSTPNMNNLPSNIKSEHKQRSKPNIVLQINTKKDSSSDQADPNTRIVTAIVRSPKKSKNTEPGDAAVDDLFTADPIQVSKKIGKDEVNTSSNHGESTRSSVDGSRKLSTSAASSSKSEKPSFDQLEPSSPKKKRKDSESNAPNGSVTPAGRKHISQKIREILESRCNQIKNLEVALDKIEKLADEIEMLLNENFKEGTSKYLNKFRSLIFNLKDQKNEGLVKNVLTGEITPARLVKMSPEEMASHELAKWRERENKHSIELIKRDAQLAAQQVIVKKTHKGEEVISAPSTADSDDPAATMGSEETSSKAVAGPEGLKSGSGVSPDSKIGNATASLKVKITGITSDLTPRTSSSSQAGNDEPADESFAFLDTTKNHKNHFYDVNCKICTKQQTDSSSSSPKKEVSKPEPDAKPAQTEQQQEQPKRFRVSIDTNIDPANLSRLREPLIKPSEQNPISMEVDEYNQYGSPPDVHMSTSNDDADEEEDLYDPELVPLTDVKPPSAVTTKTALSSEPIWSGTISMPDIPKFSASASPVSGEVEFMRDQVGKNLMVCGRIAPDQVQSYIKKLKTTTKNQILMIQLHPLADEDKANFNNFFDHLYSRNRCGVIQASPQVLKDFYVIPIHENSNIPEVFCPIKGPGLSRKEQPNCLLGLLVKAKRTTPTSSSGYTPTPIK